MLQAGAVLGSYEVVSPLGAGGMGEVYRALDTKLDREVALKVLPEGFTSDADRLARFEREARVLASLNHPHIGHIYGLEEADGLKALVLELVEGPTLADRIADGPMPLDEALPIAKQIAEALEAAHEQGIIHRDLKPANVKVRPDGTVKVLDFGLAKAFEAEGDDADASRSPTLTARATQAGVILGTAAYMAPEQARGRPVDKRADVWAFGAVLFEMLTGQRAFVGSDVTDTLASVLRSEPEWEGLPAPLPRSLERLLHRCLEKAPQRRLRDAGDARLELEEALTAEAPEAAPSARWLESPAFTRGGVLLGALGVAALALAVGFALGRGADPTTGDASGPVAEVATRTVVELPDSALLALGTQVPLKGFESQAVALSADGRHLVYVGQAEGGTRLYHRDLARFEDPRPVPGTEDALHAFFSPNASELGFLTADRVRKVALGGGTATTLCRAQTPVSATWIGDTVYFTELEGEALNRVAAEGGEPTRLLGTFERLGDYGTVSSVLPAARAALAWTWSRDSLSAEYAEIRVLPVDGADSRSLGITGYDARYLPSGHLVFGRGGSVMAAPFDAERLELRGEPVAVLGDVAVQTIFGALHAAFADNGTVAYVAGEDLARGRLAWVDRRGNEGVLDVPERVYGVFDLAPDDQRFAVQVADVRDYAWIWDASRGGEGRDVAVPGSAGWPVWSSDGNALALSTWRSGQGEYDLVLHQPRGGANRTLLSDEYRIRASSSAPPDLFGLTDWGRGPRVGVLSMVSPADPQWVGGDPTQSASPHWGAALSKDGDWIAYCSSEGTGRYQVWLEEFGGATRQQVSTDGGLEPVWCRARGELLYRSGNRFLASRITFEPQLEVGAPEVVFEAPDFVDTPGISFRLSSDGERLYYIRRSHPPVRDRIHIVQNWFSELDRLARVE